MNKELFQKASGLNYDMTKELSDEFVGRVKIIFELSNTCKETMSVRSTADIYRLIHQLNSSRRLHLQMKTKYVSMNILDIIYNSKSGDQIAYYYSDCLKIEFDEKLKYDLSQFESDAHFLSENQQLVICKNAMKRGIKDNNGTHNVITLYDEASYSFMIMYREKPTFGYPLVGYGVTWKYADED